MAERIGMVNRVMHAEASLPFCDGLGKDAGQACAAIDRGNRERGSSGRRSTKRSDDGLYVERMEATQLMFSEDARTTINADITAVARSIPWQCAPSSSTESASRPPQTTERKKLFLFVYCLPNRIQDKEVLARR